MWIMFYNRRDRPLDLSHVHELFEKSVNCIYLEILTKSPLETYPEVAQKYWSYATPIINQNLDKSRAAHFGKYLTRNNSLFTRLIRLKLNLSI